MKKIIKITAILSVLLVISCAKTDVSILKKDIDRYSAIEQELNVKIKLINEQMVKSISDFKQTNDATKFEKDNLDIENKLKNLLLLTKEIKVYIATKEMQKYHDYTIQSLEIQSEYVRETIRQFKNMGEHDNTNNAKLTQVIYGRKIREIQKKQTKLLKNIVKEMK